MGIHRVISHGDQRLQPGLQEPSSTSNILASSSTATDGPSRKYLLPPKRRPSHTLEGSQQLNKNRGPPYSI
jgi:hypothetical protein